MDIPKNLLELIQQKSAVLFLGAGGSVGATHRENKELVMGNGLARLIAEKFLNDEYYDENLEYTSGMAISATSIIEVQRFIKSYLIDFCPDSFHYEISDIAWDSIFTINYDLIVEKSYEGNRNRLQELSIFISNDDKFEDKVKTIRDVPFYKLHGCITKSEDRSIPFVLSTEQYISHLENREALFSTLYEKAHSNPIIYIGTSLRDSDIRSIILKVIQESKGGHARSYLVTPNPRKYDYEYWSERKITVLPGTLEEFLGSIKGKLDTNSVKLSLFRNDSSLLPIYGQFIVDSKQHSQLIDNFLEYNFVHVHKNMNHEVPNAKNFYKGYGQGFSPIIEGLDARRSLTDTILENYFIEDDNTSTSTLAVITGYAGSGKTILLRRLAYEAAVDFNRLVLWGEHPYNTDFSVLIEIYRRTQKRLYVFIDNANKHQEIIETLLGKAKKERLPLTIFTADRSNSWNETKKELEYYVRDEYQLNNLSEKEIDILLKLLEEHDSLGYLSDKSFQERKEAFVQMHGRQLLVALHEATAGKPFKEIVYDEYVSLYPDEAQYLYRTIATLNRFDIKVRAGLISRIHNISFMEFKDNFFEPLEGVIKVKKDESIRDYIYESRHRHVAEILFEKIFVEDEEKYAEFIRILKQLNVEYKADEEALISLTNAHNLKSLIADAELVRVIYNTVIAEYPSNAFLYQQLAIFEMMSPNGSLNKARESLNKAIEIAPHSDSIKHTLANLERRLGQQDSMSDLEKSIHRKKAKRIVQELFSRNTDSYAYVTLLGTKIDELKDALKNEETESLVTEKINDLHKSFQMATQMFPDEDRILALESIFFKTMGDMPNSIVSLEKAYNLNKANSYVALILSKHFLNQGDYSRATAIIADALDNNPNNKDLHFNMAITLMENDYKVSNDIIYHLRHAFTLGDNRYEAAFWHARALFISGQPDEARQHFNHLDKAKAANSIKLKPKGIVFENGKEKRHYGTIVRSSYSHLFVTPDIGSLELFAHASNSSLENFSNFAYGQRVFYSLAFNYKGPTAINIENLGS